MKQLIYNCLINNQLLKFTLNLRQLAHAMLAQNCVLCAAAITHKSNQTNVREQNDALQANSHAVCSACVTMLPFLSSLHCPQCGLSANGNVCGSCIKSPPNFDATHAVFLYEYPIESMMARYKYGENLHLGDMFAEFLRNKIIQKNLINQIDLVIPMPMHPTRLQVRGFNQALEIAKGLDRKKLNAHIAIRQKLTPPQASLPLKERVKNIQGAFGVNADLAPQLTGKRVAIVDDVMTSGASLNELAKTLKKAGAAHVECWVVARTMPHK